MKKSNPQNAEAVVQRVLSETVRTLPEAQREIYEAFKIRPDKATLCRWILKGRSGVKLEAIRLGRNWITSSEALHRFIVATTAKAMS